MGHVATMATVLSSLPPSTQLSAVGPQLLSLIVISHHRFLSVLMHKDVAADWTDFCSGHLAGYLQLISSEIVRLFASILLFEPKLLPGSQSGWTQAVPSRSGKRR